MLAGENLYLGEYSGEFAAATGAMIDFHGLYHILGNASLTGAGTIRFATATFGDNSASR